MIDKPLISILTPTWNRGHLLDRIYSSLLEQSCQNFEWIIADDGSIDETANIVDKYLKDEKLRIRFIHSNKRVGKARLDNEAIRISEGELTLWCDSDDYLLPETIQTLSKHWEAINAEDRSGYSGLTGIAVTAKGQILNPFLDFDPYDTSWNEIFGSYTKGSKTQDMVLCARTELLKDNPFPEVDFVVPEGVIWTKLGNLKTKVILKPLKFVEYGHIGAISYSNKMEYNRARAVSLEQIFSEMQRYDQSFWFYSLNTVKFFRYSFHGELRMAAAFQNWRKQENKYKRFCFLLFFISYIFILRDILLKNIIKTHREFEENTLTAKIHIKHNAPKN